MDTIEEIYSNEVYQPFLAYCKKNRYRKMTDLTRCAFEDLEKNAAITAVLSSRIQLIYRSYKKNHPDYFINVKPPRKTPKKPEPAVKEEVLVDVKSYLFQNQGKPMNISDIAKAVGTSRKAQLQDLMEKADWCQAVDGSNYIYVKVL